MSDNYTIKLDQLDKLRDDFAKSPDVIRRETQHAMVQAVNIVKNAAQDMAPFKTGNLRRSIFTDIQDNGFRGIVGQDSNIAPYGPDIEYGTDAHEIVPVSKKALFWKGALNPYRRVMHPGSAANPFMAPALEQSLEKIKSAFDEAILKIIKTLAA